MPCSPTPTCLLTCDRAELCPHPRRMECAYCHTMRECAEHLLDVWVCADCLAAIEKTEAASNNAWRQYVVEKVTAIEAALSRIKTDRNADLSARMLALEKQMDTVIGYFEGKRYRQNRR